MTNLTHSIVGQECSKINQQKHHKKVKKPKEPDDLSNINQLFGKRIALSFKSYSLSVLTDFVCKDYG